VAGERDLEQLINGMSPRLLDDEYVFLSFVDAEYGDYASLKPFAVVTESEGLTLIVEKTLAIQQGFEFDGSYQAITLEVHSSLDAVGLTAAFSGALAKANISANVVAGFYHDHIFVQSELALLCHQCGWTSTLINQFRHC